VARLEDRILDPRAHARITYENTVNVASYQQDGILTHRGHQYTAWYQNDGPGAGQATAVIARRALPDGAWESTRLGYTLFANDSHNTIALGVTPSDGRLHVAFPTHDGPVRYTRTVPGVLDHPDLVDWSSRLFDPVRSEFPGAPIGLPTFTYPQFENVDGRTLLTWRSGVTDDGRQLLLRYNDDPGGTWTFLGRFTHDGGGTYDGGFGTSNSRYGYLHGFSADPVTGDLAVTMSWREQGNAWCEGPLAVGNHDLGYAVSSDGGLTWHNNAGALVATTTTGDTSGTITPFTDGIVVAPIGINKGLINQETQAYDSAGRLHVVTSRVPDELIAGNCVGDFYPERAANATPYHHWRDAGGAWHTLRLPFRSGSSGRTKLAFDAADNAYVVLPDARIAAASAASGWTDWEVVFEAADVDVVSELILDRRRLREDGVLTVAYQVPPGDPALCSGSAGSPDCVSAFRLASFALGSAAPDAPKATEPEAAPAPVTGASDTQAPDLAIAIEADAPFVRGRAARYEIALDNAGERPATGAITVRHLLPEGLGFSGASGSGWSCAAVGREVECTSQADVAPGAAAPGLRIDVAVARTAGARVTSTATVRTADDHRPANNVAATETVVRSPDPAPLPPDPPDPPPPAPPASPPPVPAPPGPSPDPPIVGLDQPRRAAVAALIGRGLPVRGRCSAVGSGRLALTVTARQARRMGLGRRTTLASASVRCAAGRFAARLRAKGRARRALARLRRPLRATLTVTAAGARDRTRLTLRPRSRRSGS
jgi:BNR repeat-containing family member/Domain of unknown function DUF11